MIDIHPTHHGSFTLRDFFTHLFIVVLGILIAIGLEQSIEYIHHHHQRDDLIRQLRTEAENNVRIFQADRHIEIVQLVWCQSSLAALRNATPRNGMVEVTLPPRLPTAPSTVPERATWSLAESNGTAALLPENLAEIYQRLDLEAQRESEANVDLTTSGMKVSAVSMRLGVSLDPGTTLRLSLSDRDLLAEALSQEAAGWSHLLVRDAFWQGAADAVAHNVSSRDAMVPYMRRAWITALEAEARAGIPVSATAQASFRTLTPAEEHAP